MTSAPSIKKIALLTDGIHPLVMGGMQKHSYYLLRSLLEQGVEVLVYHPGGNGNLKDHLPEKALSLLEEMTIEFPKGMDLPGTYLKKSYAYSMSIAEDLVTREDIQFIYAQGFTGWAIAERKRKGAELPTLGVNFHGLEMFQEARGIKQKMIQYLFRPPVKFNLKHADRVYSLGGKLTWILKGFVPIEKIAVIPIAVEESWLLTNNKSFDDKEMRVLFIGRYERRKGVEELNEHITRSENASIQYHFIGPIPPSKKVNNKQAIYHGKVMDSQKLQSLIDDCHVLVVPSISEGMPTVILEAMSRGLIILATDVGAVSDQVDETNGYLMSDNSSTSIANGLDHIKSLSTEERIKRGQASINKVKQKFLWSRVIEMTLIDIEKHIAQKV